MNSRLLQLQRAVIFTLALFSGSMLLAQSAADQSAAAKPAAEQTSVPAEPGKTDGDDPDAQPSRPVEEVFIPSEEISEDFAVSFPVDI